MVYFFDNIINIKNLDPNKIEMDKRSYKNIFIYYTGYVTVKNINYIAINSVNPLYLIVNKINEYVEEGIGKTYLRLVLTDESKYTVKQYGELWNKIRDLIKLITHPIIIKITWKLNLIQIMIFLSIERNSF